MTQRTTIHVPIEGPNAQNLRDPYVREQVEQRIRRTLGDVECLWPRASELTGETAEVVAVDPCPDMRRETLTPGTGDKQAAELANEYAREGRDLVEIQAAQGFSFTAVLDENTRTVRNRFAEVLKVPHHEVEVVLSTKLDDRLGRERIDKVCILRCPAPADASARKKLWEAIKSTIPDSSVGWDVDDDPVSGQVQFSYGVQDDLAARLEGLVDSTKLVESPSPHRPGETRLELNIECKLASGPQLAAALSRQDLTLVDFNPLDHVAFAASLGETQRSYLDKFSAELKISDPWRHVDGLEIEALEGSDVVRFVRAPLLGTPEGRFAAWQRLGRTVLLAPEGFLWSADFDDGGLATFTMKVDPLAGIIPFSEDVTTEIKPDDPWRVGLDEGGVPIKVNLASSAHLLIAGATRSGKSVATYGLISHVLRMGRKARLLVADPNDTTIAPFESKVAWSTSDNHPDQVTEMLGWVRREMKRRQPVLREMRADKISEFTEELPLIVVVIDEAANYLAHGDRAAASAASKELLAVVSQGAKYGIRLVLITQRPSGEILSTSIRAQLSARISFRLEDLQSAEMVFPDIQDPAMLLTCAPGVGMFKEVAGQARKFRSVYIEDHWALADFLPATQPRIDITSAGLVIASVPGEPETIHEAAPTLDDLEAMLAELDAAPAAAPPPERRPDPIDDVPLFELE